MSTFKYLTFSIIPQYYVLVCVGLSRLYCNTTVRSFVIDYFLVIGGIPIAFLHHVHGKREKEVKRVEKGNRV